MSNAESPARLSGGGRRFVRGLDERLDEADSGLDSASDEARGDTLADDDVLSGLDRPLRKEEISEDECGLAVCSTGGGCLRA